MATTTNQPAATNPLAPATTTPALDTAVTTPDNQVTPAAPAAAPQWNVDPTKTTASQLSGIINENSPLMQQAQTAGKQYANSRGLLNSSLGAEAAQESVLKAATPIAAADANMYAQAASTNAGIASNWGLADKNIQAQTARDTALQNYTQSNMGLQQGFDLAKMDVQSQNLLKQMTTQQQNDLAKMATSQGYNLENMTAQQINDLQKMSTAQGFDITKMDVQAQNVLKQMSAQQQNDLAKMATSQGYNLESMSAQQINDLAKMTTAQNFDITKMDVQAQNVLTQLNAQQQGDLVKLAAANGYDLTRMNAQQVNDLAKMSIAQTNDIAKMDVQSQNVMAQLNAQQQGDLLKMAAAQGYDLTKMDAQQTNEMAKLVASFSQQDRVAAQKFGYDSALLNIQHQTSLDVASIEAQYKSLTQASSSASAIVNNMSVLTNNILLKDNMDATAKQTAIDQLKVNMQNALAMIGGLAGDLNLGAFFDATVPAV